MTIHNDVFKNDQLIERGGQPVKYTSSVYRPPWWVVLFIPVGLYVWWLVFRYVAVPLLVAFSGS